jgi:hypothetical protein
MRKTMLLAMTALAGQLFAGGFYLTLGNPEANPEAKKANAVLVVRAEGCHEPEKATVSATATGTVNGKRESIQLQLTKLSQPGTYALTQQWPKEGKWVIEIAGRDIIDRTTYTLVPAGPDGVDRLHAKWAMSKPFTKADVDSLLD